MNSVLGFLFFCSPWYYTDTHIYVYISTFQNCCTIIEERIANENSPRKRSFFRDVRMLRDSDLNAQNMYTLYILYIMIHCTRHRYFAIYIHRSYEIGAIIFHVFATFVRWYYSIDKIPKLLFYMRITVNFLCIFYAGDACFAEKEKMIQEGEELKIIKKNWKQEEE